MVVDVNFKQRSKKFLTILKKEMPDGWTLRSTDVEDLQKQLLGKKAGKSQRAEPAETSADIMSHPNIKAHLTKMNTAHWETWPMTPLPALKGKTPAEAIKTSDGRAAVDALITQFEQNVERNPMPGQTVETFKELRERLGL